MNQFIGTLALKPVEQMLNQFIAWDPHVTQKIANFSGKVLEINCVAPSSTLTVRFHGASIRLGAVPASALHIDAHAKISGTASTLLAALFAGEDKPLANPDLTITGDAVFVQDLFNTVRGLDIDWRDYLGPFLGDMATNELNAAGTRLRNWQNQAQSNLNRSIKDYLHDEINVAPHGSEVDHFSDQLDQLKLAIDRLDSKAQALQEKLNKSLKNQHLSA